MSKVGTQSIVTFLIQCYTLNYNCTMIVSVHPVNSCLPYSFKSKEMKQFIVILVLMNLSFLISISPHNLFTAEINPRLTKTLLTHGMTALPNKYHPVSILQTHPNGPRLQSPPANWAGFLATIALCHPFELELELLE